MSAKVLATDCPKLGQESGNILCLGDQDYLLFQGFVLYSNHGHSFERYLLRH
jgi:hypothetical protein